MHIKLIWYPLPNGFKQLWHILDTLFYKCWFTFHLILTWRCIIELLPQLYYIATFNCLNYFIKKGWSSFLIRKWHDTDSWKIMLVSLFDSSKLHLSWYSSDLFVCKKYYMSFLRGFYYYLFIYIWPVKKTNEQKIY